MLIIPDTNVWRRLGLWINADDFGYKCVAPPGAWTMLIIPDTMFDPAGGMEHADYFGYKYVAPPGPR